MSKVFIRTLFTCVDRGISEISFRVLWDGLHKLRKCRGNFARCVFSHGGAEARRITEGSFGFSWHPQYPQFLCALCVLCGRRKYLATKDTKDAKEDGCSGTFCALCGKVPSPTTIFFLRASAPLREKTPSHPILPYLIPLRQSSRQSSRQSFS